MALKGIETFLNNVIKDMGSQNAKVPINKMRVDVDNSSGKLYAPDWFKYMITGRGPGKQPPPDTMLRFVEKNPDIFASAKSKWKYITQKGLAFLIGRKIGRDGTDVFQGKRKGVDLLGAIEKNLPELRRAIVQEKKLEIMTSLMSALKKV